ncbi:MAG: PhoD-like phosphatase N-terminal domain-containing protein, partial [Planctomycetaceae bacterium]
MQWQHPGILLTVCLLCCLSAAPAAADEDARGTFSGTKTQWHDFDRFDFSLDGVDCRVVVPPVVAAGHPWIWRARFWGHEPQTEIALLDSGFHVVYCDVANLWGNEEAVRRWDSLYQYLTTKHEFSRRPVLEGMSRGGLIVYRWAIRHPAQVSCIYGDAPALGIRPYVRELEKGDPDLERLTGWMAAHDLTLQTAKKYTLDALDQLAPLAAARVPVIHVCGDADESVPFQEHTAEFARRYRKLGGSIRVIVKPGGKHHPHSLKDPAPIVDFIVASQSRVEPPITHGPFLGHVTPVSALVWARFQTAGEYRLIAQAMDGSRMSTAVARSTPERDGCVHWKLTGLQPSSRYQYRIEFQDRVLTSGQEFYLTTAAADASTPVRLVFGSCARVDEGSSAVWRRMKSLSPAAVVLLGDTPYIDSTSLDVQRQRYREFAAVPDFAELVRNRSLYGTWDDHDIGRNDTDGNLPGKEKSRQVFSEYRANAACGDGQA